MRYKYLPLPPDFDPVDATVDEVASWRRESRWTVHKKIRERVYQSYLDGRIRKILFATVKADRERAMSVKGGPEHEGPRRMQRRGPVDFVASKSPSPSRPSCGSPATAPADRQARRPPLPSP